MGQKGAYLDAIFYCPHHPHKAIMKEKDRNTRLNECRKPKPGMLLAAAEKYNIDLTQSWMIGTVTMISKRVRLPDAELLR